MCALNIRWGHKGSIQEFSTLLWAPAPRPTSLVRRPLRTRAVWNQILCAPPQQRRRRHKQLRVRRPETKQCMIAKTVPCRQPLGFSHRGRSCLHPAAAAAFPRDSFQRNQSSVEGKGLRYSTKHILDLLTFSISANNPPPAPPASFTEVPLFWSFLPPAFSFSCVLACDVTVCRQGD